MRAAASLRLHPWACDDDALGVRCGIGEDRRPAQRATQQGEPEYLVDRAVAIQPFGVENLVLEEQSGLSLGEHALQHEQRVVEGAQFGQGQVRDTNEMLVRTLAVRGPVTAAAADRAPDDDGQGETAR